MPILSTRKVALLGACSLWPSYVQLEIVGHEARPFNKRSIISDGYKPIQLPKSYAARRRIICPLRTRLQFSPRALYATVAIVTAIAVIGGALVVSAVS